MNEGALKPLQVTEPTVVDGVSAERWGFSGKGLNQTDVDKLTQKGIRWWVGERDGLKGDLMPDGRLKHPKFRSDFKNKGQKLRESRELNVKQMQRERWEAYLALPEPKPPFEKWAMEFTQRIHFDNLEWIALTAKRKGDRVKALQTLWEFTKVKPKVVTENLNAPPVAASPEQVMEAFKLIFNVPDDAVNRLLAEVPKQ